MEIKVTFRFDASESLLACVDNFRKAMEAMAASGGLAILPANKEAGIVKAVATEDGVTMNKKEQIWPPKDGGASGTSENPPAAPKTPADPSGGPTGASDASGGMTDHTEGVTPTVTLETAPSAPSVADLRAAVSRCRARIEGEDWEGKTSDGYKLYHKKVTAAVKGIVAFCGADKIPGIPEENRQSFITQVDELVLLNGEVKPNVPF